MLRKLFKSQKGQTAVEYMLMIAFGISLGLTVFKKLNEDLINNPNGLISGPINKFKNDIGADPTGRYRRFPLRMAR